MRIISWIRNLFPRDKYTYTSDSPSETRREFVYLDEVSVYSILASQRDGIATQFTETQSYSLNNQISGSAGLGFSSTRAKLDSKMQVGEVQGSQVLRKAIIQTSFKELYDIERPYIALTARTGSDVPQMRNADDLLKMMETPTGNGWLVDPSTVHRGELLEVHVELVAEPIFQLATLISAFSELIEDKEALFGQSITAQVSDMQVTARLLDSMLVGLVPIRGRLLDYDCVSIGAQDILVHRLLLNGMEDRKQLQTRSVFVVGVAERDLFWKDIRRVLFSRAPYTLFCRVATSGLTDTWNPVKFADLLTDIAPSFDEMIQEFSERARLVMKTVPGGLLENQGQDANHESDVIRHYAELLAKRHGSTLDPDILLDVVLSTPRNEGWLNSVDGQRPVFAHVTSRVDSELGVETSSCTAYECRRATVNQIASSGTPAMQIPTGDDGKTSPMDRQEKFLDAEIIAIYW